MRTREELSDAIINAAYDAEVGDFKRLNRLLDEIIGEQEIKIVSIPFEVSEAEYEYIKGACKETGLPIDEFCRKLVRAGANAVNTQEFDIRMADMSNTLKHLCNKKL